LSKIEILEKINKIKKTKIASAKEEDYLEVIYELMKAKGYAKQRDISKILNVKASSVTKMLKKLASKEMINYEKYGGVSLTNKGMKVAQDIIEKHKKLIDFLMLLGVDEKSANIEAESLEHVISEETLKKLYLLYKFIMENESIKKGLVNYLNKK
jgi:DtxR family Mn-dependent transcriptional regulator